MEEAFEYYQIAASENSRYVYEKRYFKLLIHNFEQDLMFLEWLIQSSQNSYIWVFLKKRVHFLQKWFFDVFASLCNVFNFRRAHLS